MPPETVNGRTIEIKVPLEKWVEDIALRAGKEGAQCVLDEHKKTCEALKAHPIVQKDIDAMRLGWAKLTGIIVGAAVGGGGLATLLTKLLGQ